MYSSVPKGTTTESLRSTGVRGNNNGDGRRNEEARHPLRQRKYRNSVQDTSDLSGIVTTEHTMSSSSQSPLSRSESQNSAEYALLKSNQSAGEETIVNSEEAEETDMARATGVPSPVRFGENLGEKRDPDEVLWRQTHACGPTLRDTNHQEQKQEDKAGRLESLDIAAFPTDKLLDMLTALLDKIVRSNDRLTDTGLYYRHPQEHDNADSPLMSALSFRGKHIPQISLEHYFQRIQKYCPTSNDVFLSLLVYFDRISRKCNSNIQRHSINTTVSNNDDSDKRQAPPLRQQFVMDSHNIHRLIIAGTTVSTKFFSDFFYSNSRYARVGGISLQELNYLELQFLILCDFELLISVQELQRYADLLYRFWSDGERQVSK